LEFVKNLKEQILNKEVLPMLLSGSPLLVSFRTFKERGSTLWTPFLLLFVSLYQPI